MQFAQQYELTAAVDEGVWRTLPSGLKVKVASLRSPLYKTAITRLQRKYAAEIRVNDPEIITMITAKAMAETILLDWDGAEDLEGNHMPYSREMAEEMLMKYEIFREDVSKVSTLDDNYKVGEIAEK